MDTWGLLKLTLAQHMTLLHEWRMSARTGMLAAVILAQWAALASLWYLHKVEPEQVDDAPVCADTPMLMDVLKELDVQGPTWKGWSAFKQDTVLFENTKTGQYYIVRGQFGGRSCILDGGRADRNTY